MLKSWCFVVAVAWVQEPGLSAQVEEETYYLAELNQTELVELHEATKEVEGSNSFPLLESVSVQLDGEGEAWIFRAPNRAFGASADAFLSGASLSVRAPKAAAISGRIVIPFRSGDGYSVRAFTLSAEHLVEGAREQFFRAKANHFNRVRRNGGAGSAWFRHQVRQALGEIGEEPDDAPARTNRPSEAEFDRTYDLFSGGRAVAENLQLDRIWEGADGGERDKAVADIPGIEVREYDWSARVEGLEPELDPLSTWIPDDQHALFFPTFQALVDVLDESARSGEFMVRALDPRVEDVRTQERYEAQLSIQLDPAARLLGAAVVKSLALTGSDPYLRTGSDVAVLFECSDARVLFAAIETKQNFAAKGEPSAVRLDRQALGAELGLRESPDVLAAGVRTADRTLCSYAVSFDNTVVVANSLPLLKRILAAQQGELPALHDAPEFRFFRDRYPRGSANEAAFLMLTDATIRRWCGPRWRIGASRRLRAAALLSETQAQLMPELLDGEARLSKDAELRAALGDLEVGKTGVRSSIYGGLAFQTPIIELDITQATNTERIAYFSFRDRYQREWRTFFDPIALQFQLTPSRLGVDLSVMPLIAQSTYSRLIDLTGEVELKADSGDPHSEALLHYVMALSDRGETFGMGRGFAGMFLPGVENPLGWIGESVSLYFDEDERWSAIFEAENSSRALEEELISLPIGLHVSVSNPLFLAAFLTSLRGSVDQSAPGMADWQNREHGDQTYVSIGVSEAFGDDELRIYYVALPSGLTVSANEDVIRRAIDRHQQRESDNVEKDDPREWLGKSVAVRVSPRTVEALSTLWGGSDYVDRMRARSWSNLRILNEWKRLYPTRDPVQVHESIWFTRLVCPSGRGYVWNEELQTMESEAYGCPLAPKSGDGMPTYFEGLQGAEFGLTFEDDGLRARSVLMR